SNKKNNANSIELLGTLNSGAIIMLTSNYDSIQESAYMSNTFLAYIGIIVSIIASVATFLISTRISRPILEISKIAERMADLDFEARYVVKENDEIAILGRSMNKLSDKLKQAISELKTANNELLKDIEVKEKNETMRKELISNISHELKTPIALVQGYAEGLSENINDDDIESRQFYCEVIVDEAKKMNNIVMKILDLNNIESGNSQMTIERFDIVSLINTFVSSSEILFSQKEANVEFKNQESIYVWADEFMTEEVLNNYISNALNHIEGERKINIYVEVNENIARVHIHNTGKNIPEEDIDKIWDKFYKVDKARTREYGGSGVGLSIVKAIMDSHGRKYGVNNTENGVDFWFDLETK
nr:HAMP domain-containing histidine kinase [Lachnospiraceae bacterium]